MLNQPYYINIPNVIGLKLIGNISDSVTQIDVILAITRYLRQLNLNKCYVEFIGEGCKQLTILERETISGMCEEYGALVSYFPHDSNLITYLAKSGRTIDNVECIEKYLKAAKLFQNYDSSSDLIEYNEIFKFDLSSITSTCSGPKRSQDKVNFEELHKQFKNCLIERVGMTVI
jgi:aconitase A